MLHAMQMRVDLHKLLYRLEHIEAEAMPSNEYVVDDKHNLRFLGEFIKEVDEFDRTIMKRGPIHMFDQNLDDEGSGKVVLCYGDFVIEISHRKDKYSVLLSGMMVRFMTLRGWSIRDSLGNICQLTYFSSVSSRRSYSTYVYEPTENTLVRAKSDVLSVLACMMNVLRNAPKAALTGLEQDAEYSEHAIYLGEMHTGSRFVTGFEESSYAEWALDPRVVQERADRNVIRRRMNWRVDDDCKSRVPFVESIPFQALNIRKTA
jgi:hypothetical protein